MEAWLLAPLSVLYAAGWTAYKAIYDLGWKKPFEPKIPVVTVGNVISGGAGKTPLTLTIERILREAGRKVVVSVSGYGSPRAEAATAAPPGVLDASVWGDEAAMIRYLRPETELIVGRDRVEAARIAESGDPGRILLMDDGFQHLRLRQRTTLVVDPQPHNDFCLPAGPYREPRGSGLRRATLVLPGTEFRLVRSSTTMDLVHGPGARLGDGPVDVLCALARPYRFTASLEAEGLTIAEARYLPDHDKLDQPGLLRPFDPARPLLVTAKDWVKLRSRDDLAERTIYAAGYEIGIEPEEGFRDWLLRRIDGGP